MKKSRIFSIRADRSSIPLLNRVESDIFKLRKETAKNSTRNRIQSGESEKEAQPRAHLSRRQPARVTESGCLSGCFFAEPCSGRWKSSETNALRSFTRSASAGTFPSSPTSLAKALLFFLRGRVRRKTPRLRCKIPWLGCLSELFEKSTG